jgi:hypothetical protein
MQAEQHLEDEANKLLSPFWGEGEYPVLSPRMLRRREEKEIPYPSLDLLFHKGCDKVA